MAAEMTHRGAVLIVEDDIDIRETLAEILADEGYEVASAANGLDAISYLQTEAAPCVILLDLMMPVMSGWDFLETLQDEQPDLRDIPVIVVSAAHNPQLPVGVRLLPKPLDWNTLTRAINDMITKH